MPKLMHLGWEFAGDFGLDRETCPTRKLRGDTASANTGNLLTRGAHASRQYSLFWPQDFFYASLSPSIPVHIVDMEQSYRFDLPTAFSAASLNISAEDFSARNPNEFYLVSHP